MLDVEEDLMANCKIKIELPLCHSLVRSVILLSIFRTYKGATQQAMIES